VRHSAAQLLVGLRDVFELSERTERRREVLQHNVGEIGIRVCGDE
jgi:hypothetical protein